MRPSRIWNTLTWLCVVSILLYNTLHDKESHYQHAMDWTILPNVLRHQKIWTENFFFFRSWSHRLQPKKLHTSVAVPAATVQIPSQRPLALSVTSVTSVANDKGDNEMILGAVHRYPGICLTAEENPRKPQLGDRLMKRLKPVIASNGVPFLQIRSIESHSTSGREKEKNKERTGSIK